MLSAWQIGRKWVCFRLYEVCEKRALVLVCGSLRDCIGIMSVKSVMAIVMIVVV